MKTIRDVGWVMAVLASMCFANQYTFAGIFGCRSGGGCSTGCGSGGCSTSGCNTNTNTTAQPAPEFNTGFAPRRAPTPTNTPDIDRRPITSIPGPAGPQGPTGLQGPKGDPSVMTKEMLQQIVTTLEDSLYGKLLATIKSDPMFRGKDGAGGAPGMVNEQALAAAVAKHVNKEALAAQVAGMVDKEEVAKQAAMMIDVDAVAIAAAERVDKDAIASVVSASLQGPKDLVYITAKGQKELEDLDRQIYALKAQGVPIMVVKLDPKDTVVKGVPKIHSRATKDTISGLQSVKDYVAKLTPQR